MKLNRVTSTIALAGLVLFGLGRSTAPANDWIGGIGDWSAATNWNGGVPSATVGNVANGGTAIVTNTVPNVTEAWCGNGASGGPSGGAGNMTVGPGGVLNVDYWLVVARMCCPSTTACPLSILTVDGGTINKAGNGFIVGDNAGGLTGLGGTGQLTLKGNAVVNVTGGWFTACPGGYGQATVTMQDNAQWGMGAQDWNMGEWGHGRTVFNIKDNATLTLSRFFLARWDYSVAVLNQSGGSIIGSGANPNEWTLAGDGYNTATTNSFAFYNKSGGMLNCPYNFQVGRWGNGVFYQTAGTNTFGGWTSIGRMYSGLGIMRVSGGSTVHTGGGQHIIIGEQGRGEFTLDGAGVLDCALSFVVGHGYGGYNGTGFGNFNGGTATVAAIERWGSGSGYLGLNGTTIRPKASNANFLTGLTDVRIYAGNAIFDTAGYDITIGQGLNDGGGTGVTAIPVSSGGAGYLAPPIVQISGDGFGATAVAQIDVNAGTVTNILITCSGIGYTTASATLIGGGGTTAAAAGAPTLGAVTGGGVVKNGAGTLTLSGANLYTGLTAVNQGTLLVTPASSGMGAVTVADGAGFGVALPYSGQALFSSVTLGATSGATLAFDLGTLGNPLSAPLNVLGNLAVNGTVTVNIADAAPQLGQVPLLQYNTRSGSGSIVLGSLPSGVQGTLVDDTVNKLVYLNITSIGLPRWDGQAGGTWDVNVTTNWIELTTGLPTFYKDGAPVLFDDEALGVTTVNLITNVKPASVTVSNLALSYTLVGTGKVSGATSLLKLGGGSFTIANSTMNDYSGPTIVAGGTLAITNLANGGMPSAIGASSAAATNLVLTNGILSYSGPAVAVNRGYLVQGPNSAIDAESDLAFSGQVAAALGGSFVKQGPGKLGYTATGDNELSGGAWPGYNITSGTVVFDGSAGPQTNHNVSEFWIGGTPTNGASLILTNTTLNIDSWLAIGRGNGSSGFSSTATLYNSTLHSGAFSMGYDNGISGNLQSPVVTFNGASSFTNNGDANLGESPGSSAALYLNDNSIFYSAGRLFVGWHSNVSGTISATGAVTLASSSKMYVNAWLSIGNEGGVGTMVAKGGSYLWVLWDLNLTDVNSGEGAFTLQDSAYVEANNAYVAKGIGSTAVFTQTGGTLRTRPNNSEFHVGSRGNGTYNMSGGTVNSDGNWTSIGRYNGGVGVLNVSGGTFNHNDTGKWLQVGEEGNGTLNISMAGVVTDLGDRLLIANNATASGVVNLDGGTLSVRRVLGGAGPSTFNFNGGLLQALPNAMPVFMTGLSSAYVEAGGARIDTGASNLAINQALLDGTGGGGLTKTGVGILYLNGTNTYTGPTLISAGALGGNGVIAGPVTVASGASLQPGSSVGLLTVSNTLTLAGGSTTVMELNKTLGTNDSVQGVTTLTYGGTVVLKNLSGLLAANDTFPLFAANTYGGAFTNVVSQTLGQTVTWDTSRLTVDGTVKVASAVNVPVSIASSVGGGKLNLAWPADQTGWILQTQTNSLAVGLGTNWVTVVGSTTTNQMSFPVSTTPGGAFFRLVLP